LPTFSIPTELPISNLDGNLHMEGVATNRPLLTTAGSLGLSKQLGMAPGSAFSAAAPFSPAAPSPSQQVVAQVHTLLDMPQSFPFFRDTAQALKAMATLETPIQAEVRTMLEVFPRLEVAPGARCVGAYSVDLPASTSVRWYTHDIMTAPTDSSSQFYLRLTECIRKAIAQK
jgi:hypothetical protein